MNHPLVRLTRLRFGQLEDRCLPAFSTPIASFAGQGYSSVLPPDTVGDVGVYSYVQATNASTGTNITIYDKSGTPLFPQFSLRSLAPPGTAGVNGIGDPIVLYDQLADRWLLAEFSNTPNNALCFYISDNGRPSNIPSDWTYWQLNTTNFPDYPKITAWNNAYFMGCNEGDNPVYALDRAQMLSGSGGTITAVRRTTTARPNWPRSHIMPADIEGFNLAPSGSPGLFVRQVDDEFTTPGTADPANDFLEIWEFQPNFATPASSTYSKVQTVAITDFDYQIGSTGRDDIDQLGSGVKLDALPHYIMWRLTYRNWGTYESLVANFTVDAAEDASPDFTGGTATEQAGVRWFELRRTGAAPWNVYQQQTYAPDTSHRWMASAAMNGDGEIAIGHSVSSSTMFASIAYAGRQPSDPLGTMPAGPHILRAGTGAQTNAASRWGDYSALSVDPVDDHVFWYTTEYANASNTWSTHIGAFDFDDADRVIYGTVNNDTISVGRSGANVSITLNGSSVRNWPFATLNSLTFRGLSGNDTFFIDSSLASAIPPGGLAIDGGEGADTILGDNIARTFLVSGANSGSVVGVATFSNIESLTGGGSNDTFQFSAGGSLGGGINGQTGNDVLIGDDVGRAFTILGPNSGSVVGLLGAGFNSVETVVGGSGQDQFSFGSSGQLSGSVDGGSGDDTIVGNNSNRVFVISGLNAGSLAGLTTLGFAGVESLVGGSGEDTFQLVSGGSLVGGVDGASGADKIVSDGQGRTYALSGMGAGGMDGIDSFAGIESIQAGSGEDELRGDQLANTYSVLSAGSGSITGKIAFSGVELLVGGVGNDWLTVDNANHEFELNDVGGGELAGLISFSGMDNIRGGSGSDELAFLPGGSLLGQFDGGAGADTVDLSPLADPVAFSIRNLTSTGYLGTFPVVRSVLGINKVIGSSSPFDQLIGGPYHAFWKTSDVGVDSTYRPNASSPPLAFLGIEELTGSGGNDTFEVSLSSNSSPAMTVNGGTGTDRLTATGGAGTDLFQLFTQHLVNNGKEIHFGGVERISAYGGEGADSFVSQLTTLPNVTQIDFYGEGGNDVMQVKPLLTTRIRFDGGAGRDRLLVDTVQSGKPIKPPIPTVTTGTYRFPSVMPIDFVALEDRTF